MDRRWSELFCCGSEVVTTIGDRREEEYRGRQRVEEELRGGKEVIADAGAMW